MFTLYIAATIFIASRKPFHAFLGFVLRAMITFQMRNLIETFFQQKWRLLKTYFAFITFKEQRKLRKLH